MSLARERGLRGYDAAWLELAMRLGLLLATGDRGLAAAAQRAGVVSSCLAEGGKVDDRRVSDRP